MYKPTLRELKILGAIALAVIIVFQYLGILALIVIFRYFDFDIHGQWYALWVALLGVAVALLACYIIFKVWLHKLLRKESWRSNHYTFRSERSILMTLRELEMRREHLDSMNRVQRLKQGGIATCDPIVVQALYQRALKFRWLENSGAIINMAAVESWKSGLPSNIARRFQESEDSDSDCHLIEDESVLSREETSSRCSDSTISLLTEDSSGGDVTDVESQNESPVVERRVLRERRKS